MYKRQVVSSSVKKFTGTSPDMNAKGGTSDGRFIAKMDTEIVELGPSNETIHQIDECVNLDELVVLKNIYKDILIELNQKI